MASRVFRMFKTMPFRDGGEEEFSNVYRYSVSTAGTTFPQDRAQGVIQALLELEKPAHGPSVVFTRCESAEVSALNNVLATDLVVEFGAGNTGTNVAIEAGEEIPPEIVTMVQERVGPKRWLRKYLHTLSVGFAANTEGIAFSFETADTRWSNVTDYALNMSPLTFVEPDASTSEAIYEAGNGTPSEGFFTADPQIRWHDLKY